MDKNFKEEVQENQESLTNYESTSNRYVVLMRARQMLEEMIVKNIAEKNPEYNAAEKDGADVESIVNALIMPFSFNAFDGEYLEKQNANRSLENEFSVLQIYEMLFDPKHLNEWAKAESKKQGVSLAEIKNGFEYKFKYALYKNAVETKEILNFGDKEVILGSGGAVDLDSKNVKLETLISTYCSNLEGLVEDVADMFVSKDARIANGRFESYFNLVKNHMGEIMFYYYGETDAVLSELLFDLVYNDEKVLSVQEMQACYTAIELINNSLLTEYDNQKFVEIITNLEGVDLDSTCSNSIEVAQKIFVREISKIRQSEIEDAEEIKQRFDKALKQMRQNFQEIESFKDAEVADKAIVSYKSNIAEAYLDKHIQSEEERVTTINEQSTETDMLYFALYKASNVSTHNEFERLVQQMQEYEEAYGFSDNARNAITKVFNTKVPNEDALLSDEKYRIDYAERSVGEFFTFTSEIRPTHKKYVKELERGLSGHLSYASKLDKVKQREKEEEDSKNKEDTNSQDNAYQYDELVDINPLFDENNELLQDYLNQQNKPQEDENAYQYDELVDLSPLFDENNELLQEELNKEQEKAIQQQIDNVVYSSWELINKIDAEKVGDDEYADAIGAKENEFQQLIETFTNITKPKETQLVEIYGDKYEKATESEKQALEIEARSTHKLQELNENQKQKYIEKIESSKQELENDRRIAYTGGLFTNYDGTTLSEENIQLLGGVRRLCNEINKDFAQEDPRCKKLIEDAKKLTDIKGFYAKQCESKEKQLENLFGDDYINATDEDKLKMEERAISSHRVFVYNDGQRIEVLVNIENAFKDLEKAKNDLESQLNQEAEVDIDYDFKNPDGTPLSEENRAFFDGLNVLIAEMKASGLYGLSSVNKMTDEEYKNASNVEKFRVMLYNLESALNLYNQTSLTQEEHLVRIYGQAYLNETDEMKKRDMLENAKRSGELHYSSENTSLKQRESMLSELQQRSNDIATIYYYLLTDKEQQNITPTPSPAPSPNPTPSPMPNPSAEEESSKEDDKPKKENKKVAKSKGPEYETSVQTGRLSTFLKKPGVINSIRATGVFLALMTVVFFFTGAWLPAILLTTTLTATLVADVTYTRKLKEAQKELEKEVEGLVKDATEAGAKRERLRQQMRELEDAHTQVLGDQQHREEPKFAESTGYQYDQLENLESLFDENNELLQDYINAQENPNINELTAEERDFKQGVIKSGMYAGMSDEEIEKALNEAGLTEYTEKENIVLSKEERAEQRRVIKEGIKEGLSDEEIEQILEDSNLTNKAKNEFELEPEFIEFAEMSWNDEPEQINEEESSPDIPETIEEETAEINEPENIEEEEIPENIIEDAPVVVRWKEEEKGL